MLLKKIERNNVQSLFDKADIKELIEFERFCRDNSLWEEMKKCFTPDSKITVSWFQGSGHDFVEASSKMSNPAPHKLNNTLIWINEDKAVAITMASIQTRIKVDGCELELTSDVKLIYRTKKIDGNWHVYSMDGIYEKDCLIPSTPNSNISIPMEELSKFRSSYANLSYCLSKSGYEINQDLPGIDKPELIEAIYTEFDEWLIG